MIYVKGKNVNLYVFRDDEYVLAICSTNISRSGTGGTLTTLVRGAGSVRRFKPTIKEETVTLEGLRTIDTPTSFQIHEFEIGSYYTVRIVYDDLAGNTIQLDGQVLVTGIDDNNGATDFSTWSVTMVRNGQWAFSATGGADVTPPTVTRARAIGPNTVRVTFNEGVLPTTFGWTVNNGSTYTITAVSGAGNVWDFTTSGTINTGDTPTLSYAPLSGNTNDLGGNEMASLTDYPIENAVLTAGTYEGALTWSLFDPYPIISGGDDLEPYVDVRTFTSGAPMVLSPLFSNIYPPLYTGPRIRYFVAREPDTEPVKTNWHNTAFNNGTIGDSVFRNVLTIGGYHYYITRNPTAITYTQPLTFS